MKGNLRMVGNTENGIIKTSIVDKKPCKECGKNQRKNGSARCLECSNAYIINKHEENRINKMVDNAK